jgi:hypothetical protein
MSFLKAMLTRAAAGQVVHVVLALVRPEVKVNHILVTLVVFFVAAISGVGTEADEAS